ncbi:MAG: regulatory protein RecX [Actinomycetales bacterium]
MAISPDARDPAHARRQRSRREGTPRDDIVADPEPDHHSVARRIVLDQLTRAARSRAELEASLARRNVPAAVARDVLDRMEQVELVDDAAFAQQWVESRHRSRGLARRSLAAELHRKGIDAEVAQQALGTLDPDREIQTARDLVARKLRATRGQDPAARMRKLASMLARKGYSAGVSYTVVREALAREGVDADEFEPTDLS